MASHLNVTRKLRSFFQPWVARHVINRTPLLLQIQKYEHRFLDALFSGLSCVVSMPFYTAFLPLLFWSWHGRLARQMTLLMAFCDYFGNCVKDVVSAPRPSSPPVRRITATKDKEVNAMEYGLPSSHTLNTICLSGYLLDHLLSYPQYEDAFIKCFGLALVCLVVGLIGLVPPSQEKLVQEKIKVRDKLTDNGSRRKREVSAGSNSCSGKRKGLI